MKQFETNTIKLSVHKNGFVELVIKNNAVFDTTDILDSKKFITEVLKEKKAYILLEAEGTFYTTREARELGASPEHPTHHGAIAFCSDKLAYKILGKLYIKINRPKVPTKYFTKRKEAVKWLETFLK
ncbi:MAG: hypothetical protein JNK50_09840 [Bacteroidia bacterium]|nr:hypothetical protein [Bacteroidia bacterium]